MTQDRIYPLYRLDLCSVPLNIHYENLPMQLTDIF